MFVSYPHTGEHGTPVLTHLHAPFAHLDFLHWHSINTFVAGICVISTGIKQETVIVW